MRRIIILAISLVFLLSGTAFAGPHAESDATANNNIETMNDIDVNMPNPKDVSRSLNDGTGYRGFANGTPTMYPGIPAHFGPGTKGPLFQGVESLLEYKDTFTLDEMKRMSKNGVGLGFLGTSVIVTPLVESIDEYYRSGEVKVVLEKPEKATLKAFITVKATNNGKVSAEVLAEAMLAARKYGANTIQVSAEGVERVITAFGWGIGLAYTKATISDSESMGGVASGGTGISGGEAGYKDRPWIQLFAVAVPK